MALYEHLVFYTQAPVMLGSGADNFDDLNCPLAVRERLRELSYNCSEMGPDFVELYIGHNLKSTYFSIASCSLSCVGSILIFLAYFVLKGIRNVAQKIITLLALADFFTAMGYLIADWNFLRYSQSPQSCAVFDEVCKIQSFITSTSSICSFGWTCALAIHFYLLLSRRSKRFSLSTLLVWQNVILWTFPLLIVVPLLVTNKLGYSTYATSNWCFIKGQSGSKEEIALILVGGKLWEILSYLLVVVLYALTTKKFNKQIALSRETQSLLEENQPQQLSAQREAHSEVKHRLLLIPIMFILLRMWGTTQFFYSLAKCSTWKKGCASKGDISALSVLGIAQAIGDGGQGWSNALLYIFLSPTLRKQLFVVPIIKLLHFSIKKAGLTHVIEEPPSNGEKREPKDTRLQSDTRPSRSRGLLQTGDYSSDVEWDTVDSGVVG